MRILTSFHCRERMTQWFKVRFLKTSIERSHCIEYTLYLNYDNFNCVIKAIFQRGVFLRKTCFKLQLIKIN